MNKQEFKKLADSERRAKKNNWVFLREQVNGVMVSYKAFNTWVQVLTIELPARIVKDSSTLDCKVAEYRAFMSSMLDLVPGD